MITNLEYKGIIVRLFYRGNVEGWKFLYNGVEYGEFDYIQGPTTPDNLIKNAKDKIDEIL